MGPPPGASSGPARGRGRGTTARGLDVLDFLLEEPVWIGPANRIRAGDSSAQGTVRAVGGCFATCKLAASSALIPLKNAHALGGAQVRISRLIRYCLAGKAR